MHTTTRPRARRWHGAAPGFTLIELLVVLAIVATLLALVTPRYFQRVERAREAVLRDNLRAVRTALDQFYGDQGRYPDTLDELVQRHYLRTLPLDPLTEAADTWRTLPPPDGLPGGVYDIRSGATGQARDGGRYEDW